MGTQEHEVTPPGGRERSSMATARNVAMPDLSALEAEPLVAESLRSAFGFMLGAIQPHPEPAQALLNNYCRIVDKAVREYELARSAFTAYSNRSANKVENTLLFIRGLDHIESCLNSLHRAVLNADALKRNRDMPKIEHIELLNTSAVGTINDFRDAIEHNDEKLTKGEIVGEWTAPYPSPDRVEFDGVEIKFWELASWITRVHALGHRLVRTRGLDPTTG